MRKVLLTLTLLLMTVGVSGVASAQDVESPRPCVSSSVMDFLLMTPRTTMAFKPLSLAPSSTSAFDCDPCCTIGSNAYNGCMRQRSGTVCSCLWRAYENCLWSGCGPCQCCADYLRRMETYSCIE